MYQHLLFNAYFLVVHCPALPNDTHGEYDHVNCSIYGLDWPSSCSLHCEVGWIAEGNVTTDCQLDSQWDTYPDHTYCRGI